MRFQKKAWADEALCEDYALVEMAEITAAARLDGRESVAIFDNLHGQTTRTHLTNLARNRCKRHLLPANTTDELQLVDAGVGHALKTEMAHLHDDWLSKDNNLELWTAAADFPVWRKRVLVTWLAAQAWENVCTRFDFEGAATRLGMRMTIDGSGDELIQMQGVEHYCFNDEDGGESAFESEDDDFGEVYGSPVGLRDGVQAEGLQSRMREASTHEMEHMGEGPTNVQSTGGTVGNEVPLTQQAPGGDLMVLENHRNLPLDDEEKTESFPANTITSCLADAAAPPGYIMVQACPPLGTRCQKRSLIGKTILYAFEQGSRCGWFVGRVAHDRVSARDKREVPTANYVVRYTPKQTNGLIDGLVACELSARTYGASQWWVLLQCCGVDVCHKRALERGDISD